METPVDEIRHKSNRATIGRDVKRSAAIEVEDVLHVLIAVVEEKLVLCGKIGLITVSQRLHLTLALGEPTKSRVWDLVGKCHIGYFFLIKELHFKLVQKGSVKSLFFVSLYMLLAIAAAI